MSKEEVVELLTFYGDSPAEIDHVLSRMEKIRSTIKNICTNNTSIKEESPLTNHIEVLIKDIQDDIALFTNSNADVPPLYVTGPDQVNLTSSVSGNIIPIYPEGHPYFRSQIANNHSSGSSRSTTTPSVTSPISATSGYAWNDPNGISFNPSIGLSVPTTPIPPKSGSRSGCNSVGRNHRYKPHRDQPSTFLSSVKNLIVPDLPRSKSHEFGFQKGQLNQQQGLDNSVNRLSSQDIGLNQFDDYSQNTSTSQSNYFKYATYHKTNRTRPLAHHLNSANKRDDVNSGGVIVPHQFVSERKLGIFFKSPKCAACGKRIYTKPRQQCVNCKVLVHTRCSTKCTRSCYQPEPSDYKGRKNYPTATMTINRLPSAQSTPAFQRYDSNSPSSCTSSTPGSPFPRTGGQSNSGVGSLSPPNTNLPSPGGATTTASPRIQGQINQSAANHFEFSPNITDDPRRVVENGSIEGSPSFDVDRSQTNGVRRNDSVTSDDSTPNIRRNDSIYDTLKKLEISKENLQIFEIIGRGTYSKVCRGTSKLHGDVAVKFISLDEGGYEAFKREVAMLHKTRHVNLVLFVGVYMQSKAQPAIVTRLSPGKTLYQMLHCNQTIIAINTVLSLASQIATGMGYLHNRGIVHRDLKTRNIFIESQSNALISDFGVSNTLCLGDKPKCGNYLNVPAFWLCYLAPEVVQSLKLVSAKTDGDLALTFKSDVYAFGTVWYELLTNKFPYKNLPAETIIYLSGNGVKPSLNISVPKDFKDLLVKCWAFDSERRPEFTKIVEMIDHLPKLHRSPSHPVKPSSLQKSRLSRD